MIDGFMRLGWRLGLSKALWQSAIGLKQGRY
jgi:hypothetical protein